jgi:hypothetical protein
MPDAPANAVDDRDATRLSKVVLFFPPEVGARRGGSPRLLVATLLAGALVAATLGFSANFRSSDRQERGPYAGDFLHEWTGAYIVRSGDASRLYDPSYANALQHDPDLVGFRLRADGFLPLVYPPVYYLALSPLAALPYRTAAWVWVALTLACFAIAALLLGRAVGPFGVLGRLVPPPDAGTAHLRRLGALLALPAAVAFLPFAENLVSGQKATMILLVLTVTWIALQHGFELTAGLVFGAMAVKPQLAFVIPIVLLVKGAWRFALGAAITACVLASISAAMGIDLVREYVSLAQSLPERIRFGPGQLHRIHGLYGFFTVLGGAATWWVRAATLVAAGAVVALLVRLFRGPLDVRSPRFAVQYAGLVVATVLLAPNVVTYDLTMLILPIFVLGWLLAHGSVRPEWRSSLSWLLVGVYVTGCVGPSIAQRLSIQPTMPLLAALLASLGSTGGVLHPASVPGPATTTPDAGWEPADARIWEPATHPMSVESVPPQ